MTHLHKALNYKFIIILMSLLLVFPGASLGGDSKLLKIKTAYVKAKQNYLSTKEYILKLESDIKSTPSGGIASPDEQAKKRASQSTQLHQAFERLNKYHREAFEAKTAYQNAILHTPPAILKNVSVSTKASGELYNAGWEGGVPDALKQKIEEQEQLLDKVESKIQDRIASRRDLVTQLAVYNKTYAENAASHTNNVYYGIFSSVGIDAIGLLAEFFLDQSSATVDVANLIGSVFAQLAPQSNIKETKESFITELAKFKKAHGKIAPDKYSTLKSSLTSDITTKAIEVPSVLTLKCGLIGFAKDTTTKNVDDLASTFKVKNVARSFGISAATMLVKAMVKEYFQQEADEAKRKAFEAYVGSEFYSSIINKSIQQDAELFQIKSKIRSDISDLKQQENCKQFLWKKKTNKANTLRSIDVGRDVNFTLTFSSQLTATPQVIFQGKTVKMKPSGQLPSAVFSGHVPFSGTKNDGVHQYGLEVSANGLDTFDGNPETIPVFDTKKGSWETAEPVDKMHSLSFINYQNLIKELEGYRKTNSDYIIFMSERFGYNARTSLYRDLTRAGVGKAAQLYTDTWLPVYPWQLDKNSAMKYVSAHDDVLASSISYLKTTAREVDESSIKQLRDGVKKLGNYHEMTKQAFMECWMDRTIARGKYWDKYDETMEKFFSIPNVYGNADSYKKLQAQKAELKEQANLYKKQSDESGVAAAACLEQVKKNPKDEPLFVSLEILEKAKK